MTREQADHILTAFLIMPSGGEAQNALREVIIDAMCTQTIITPPHPLIPANNKPVNCPGCGGKVVE